MVETYLTPKQTPPNISRRSSPTSLHSFDDDANTPSGLISVDSKFFNHEDEDEGRTSSSSPPPPSLKFKFDYFDTSLMMQRVATDAAATSTSGCGNSLSRTSDLDDDDTTAPFSSSAGGGLSSEDCRRYRHHSATPTTTAAATLVYQHNNQGIRKYNESWLKPRPSADLSSSLSSSLSSLEDGSSSSSSKTSSSSRSMMQRRTSSSSIKMDDYITSKKMKIQVL